ncbi:MAG TPA: PfkB family carbohydrate kinase [Anaerolineaceae bacterium]|nr:PfkB family carbohydrate kinase [Anaerolineaceae bacterium]
MKSEFVRLEPVDYLVIGHIAQDITSDGLRLGGTASYAALTAKALGLKVGIVTACTPDLELPELDGITISAIDAEYNTTFENINTSDGRIQYIHHVAPMLDITHVPETWRRAPIVHLGPIAQEIDPKLARSFPDSQVGLTLQGWLRTWDKNGLVRPAEWPEASYVLEKSTAAVISIEDVQGDEYRIEEMLASIRILAVTEASAGARLYWNGDLRRFRAPKMVEVDPTGSGDIFAAAFFYRLWTTRDPWESARFATTLAAYSVARPGLQGIPTAEEIQNCMVEVLPRY